MIEALVAACRMRCDGVHGQMRLELEPRGDERTETRAQAGFAVQLGTVARRNRPVFRLETLQRKGTGFNVAQDSQP